MHLLLHKLFYITTNMGLLPAVLKNSFRKIIKIKLRQLIKSDLIMEICFLQNHIEVVAMRNKCWHL